MAKAKSDALSARDDVIQSKDAKILDLVDPTKVYRVVLQFGSHQRWRRYGGGKFKEVSVENDPRGGFKKQFKLEPRVHETDPLDGWTVNGLIAAHNKWVEANKNATPVIGDIRRMFIVADVTETSEAPTGRIDKEDRMAMRIASSIVNALVQAGAFKGNN